MLVYKVLPVYKSLKSHSFLTDSCIVIETCMLVAKWYSYISDWICEKGSYTHIQFFNFKEM